MSRTLTEKKVLKKLGIPDFRHMTKDKVISFATMLPKMDPEVAKKALEQFPEFAKTSLEIVGYYKEVVEQGIKENSASVQSFYATCDSIIDTLKEQLQNETLSFEEKCIIIDKMIELTQMKFDKDAENKAFILKVLAGAAAGTAVVVLALAAVLGAQSNIAFSPGEDSNDDSIDGDDGAATDVDIVDYQ